MQHQPDVGTDRRSSRARAWSGVVILWFFYVISFMDRGVIALMVQPIMRDLAITKVQMGVLQGFAFALPYSLAVLPLGWAVDRYHRQRILCAAVFIWSLGTFGCGFAHSYDQMVLARAVVGLGEAALTPTALSLIADLFPRERIATATAVFSSGATVGVGAALLLGGPLLHRIELQGGLAGISAWQLVFLCFGAVGMLSVPLGFAVPDERQGPHRFAAAARPEPASFADFGRFLVERLGLIICLFVSFPLLLAVSNAYLAWTPHHFETAFGWDARRVGLLLGSMNLIAPVSGVIAGGVVMDATLRRGVRAPHATVPLLSTLIGAPMIAMGLLSPKADTALLLLAVGLFIYNFFASAQGTLVQLLAPPALRGRFAAVYMMVVSLVGLGLGALLPPLIDSMRSAGQGDVGWATAMSILGIATLASLALVAARPRLHAALRQTGQPFTRRSTTS